MKYVSSNGYSGYSAYQSVLWHYKTDMSIEVLNRWFANIFNDGVLYYEPTTESTNIVRIKKGTSFIIKQKDCEEDDKKIAKIDVVLNFDFNITGYGDGLYHLIAVWENLQLATRGCDFFLVSSLPTTYNYVKLGEVTINGGIITNNTNNNQTKPGVTPALYGGSGYSGYLGISGYSGLGESGYSGMDGAAAFSGYSGIDGTSGYSGISGFSGVNPGPQGISGYSGAIGGIGNSGTSGYSGVAPTYTECLILALSDEYTNLVIDVSNPVINFRSPYALNISKIKGSLRQASSSGTVTIRILKNDVWIATLGIGANNYYNNNISEPFSLVENDKINMYITGAGTNAQGLKLYLIGTKT